MSELQAPRRVRSLLLDSDFACEHIQCLNVLGNFGLVWLKSSRWELAPATLALFSRVNWNVPSALFRRPHVAWMGHGACGVGASGCSERESQETRPTSNAELPQRLLCFLKPSRNVNTDEKKYAVCLYMYVTSKTFENIISTATCTSSTQVVVLVLVDRTRCALKTETVRPVSLL